MSSRSGARISLGQAHKLVRIAESFDETFLKEAGVHVHDVNTLEMGDLKKISDVPHVGTRKRRLLEKLGRLPIEKEPKPAFQLKSTCGGGEKLEINEPVKQLPTAEARKLVRQFSATWKELNDRAKE